jgi:hypothetical protein
MTIMKKTANGIWLRNMTLNRASVVPPIIYGLKKIEEQIKYELNDYGFREIPSVDNHKRAAFGCSLTYGFEVDRVDAWPYLLNAYNFGVAGCSPQTVSRLVSEWIPDSNFEEIFIVMPDSARREVYDELTEEYYHFGYWSWSNICQWMYTDIEKLEDRISKLITEHPELNIFNEEDNKNIMEDCIEKIEAVCEGWKVVTLNTAPP